MKKKVRESDGEIKNRGTDGAAAAQLLSWLLRAVVCWLLFSLSNFCPPLMSPNLATRLFCSLFYLLGVIPLWTRPIERISASSSRHPSLQSSSEASGLEKKTAGGGRVGGPADRGG